VAALSTLGRSAPTYAGADWGDRVADQAIDAAATAEAKQHVLEAENRRLRAELQAVRGALRTACRVLVPYYVDDM
jgi:hypothetical protein